MEELNRLTDRTATTLFAQNAPSPMLTDRTASTLLAVTALSLVLTDRTATTLLALTALSPMLTGSSTEKLSVRRQWMIQKLDSQCESVRV